tara:strand:+ start:3682 stop:3921 length:240 start_codon:yes stop_codon:yes gene_type:complete
MDNKQKYQDVFIKSLSIDESKFSTGLKYNEIPEWDSIGHMTLISGLEEGFGISMETDDIIDFSSYNKGIEILQKYKVKI